MDTKKSKYAYVEMIFGFLPFVLIAGLYWPVLCTSGAAEDSVNVRGAQTSSSVSSFLNRIIGEPNKVTPEPEETVAEPNQIPAKSDLVLDSIWYAGTWDSTLYPDARYPQTVAVKIKLLDKDTRLPITGAGVALKGEYVQTLSLADTQNQIDLSIFHDLKSIKSLRQRHKFGLDAISDSNGFVVFSLNWHKEYSWKNEEEDKASPDGAVIHPNDIECAATSRITHPDYKQVEMPVDFKRMVDLKPVVLDLGEKFADFKNTHSRRTAFFEKIRAGEYGTASKDVKSSTDPGDQTTCGPYLVYDLGDVLLERTTPRTKVSRPDRAPTKTPEPAVAEKPVEPKAPPSPATPAKTPEPTVAEKPVEPKIPPSPPTPEKTPEPAVPEKPVEPKDQNDLIISVKTPEPKIPEKPAEQKEPSNLIISVKKPEPAVTEKPVQPKEPLTQKPDQQGIGPAQTAAAAGRMPEPSSTYPKEKIINLGNGVTLILALIPAGEFQMGSPLAERGRDSDEGPVHTVRIDQPFYMGVYEVTQEQYEKVMGTNPSKYAGPKYPVHMVSWYEAQEFCQKLSKLAGGRFRLPTEAEWEYACRAGTTTAYYWGTDYDGHYAWSILNSQGATHEVGNRLPNAWGLYDMSGSMWEWCEDPYHETYSDSHEKIKSKTPADRVDRVLRGGSWNLNPESSRSANRSRNVPETRMDYDGFRIVLDVK